MGERDHVAVKGGMHGVERLREVAIPFAIFTVIWGSTWIVIRGQLGTVAPQWSVAYRFVIAAIAMALVARFKGESLRIERSAIAPALVLGFCQFCINFDAVYMAERHITSGVVAMVFALLLIPASLMAWALLGQRPTRRFAWSSLVKSSRRRRSKARWSRFRACSCCSSMRFGPTPRARARSRSASR